MQHPQTFKMTRLLGLPAAALLSLTLLSCGGGTTTPMMMTSVTLAAALSGDQEVTPTTTGGVGTGTLTLTTPSNAVMGSISINGLSATAAHIHQGAAGSNGPVLFGLTESSPGSGSWAVPPGTTFTQAQADAFASGGLYFNAHTLENTGGDIRGQIGREVSTAQMTSAQEALPNASNSSATGNGLFSFDPLTKKFSARLTVAGMTAVAAHIHSGTVGSNGGVLFPLTQTAAGSATWVSAADAVLTDAQVMLLNSGGLYFNAHSVAFSNGEIRGQIGRNVRVVTLSGDQETTPTGSSATGLGTLIVDPVTRAVSGSFTVTGTTATMGHIHSGAAGTNGPIIVPMTMTGMNMFSVPAGAVFTADQFRAFKQGGLYFNAHSAVFPSGEIRGQIGAISVPLNPPPATAPSGY